MVWWLFLIMLGLAAIPSFVLMADRILDVDGHDVIRRWGVPYVVVSAAALVVAIPTGSEYIALVGWGALAGLLGTIALDIVRLIGLKAGTFPLDMPIMFGLMSFGKARLLQSRVMGQVLQNSVDSGTVKEFVGERIERITTLSERQRANAVAAMVGGIATLPESTREEVSEAQATAMGSLDSHSRQTVMRAMDAAGSAARPGQPRGLPRVAFSVFRSAADRGIDSLWESHPPLMRRSLAAGYFWHAVNGVSFGVAYTLLVGQGNVAWALGWGVFVWVGMMVAMPAMMPVLKLPAWFPIVPLIAHVAMVVPYFPLTSWVSDAANQASLLGWLIG